MKERYYRDMPSLKTTCVPKIWEYIENFWKIRSGVLDFERDMSVLKVRRHRRIMQRKVLDEMVNSLVGDASRQPRLNWHVGMSSDGNAAAVRVARGPRRRKKRKKGEGEGGSSSSAPSPVIVGYGKGKASKFFKTRLLKRQNANPKNGRIVGVHLVDEYFTSQKCCCCLQPLYALHRPKCDISEQKWIYPPYTVRVCREARKHPSSHSVYWSRDKSASVNILHLLLCWLRHPECDRRPCEFQKDDTSPEQRGPSMVELLSDVYDTGSGPFTRE
jgi:hypothetical protein